MQLKRNSLLALSIGLTAVVVACSSSSTTSTSGPSAPTCATACGHLSSVCSMLSESSCEAQCASISDSQRSCVDGAGDCTSGAACFQSSGTDGGSTSNTDSGGGGGGGTVTCAPFTQFTDTNMSCAAGCVTAQADDMKSLWCLKTCTTQTDCGGDNACVQAEGGNQNVCIPTCTTSSDCTSKGYGDTCETLHNPAYCNGGPVFLF